MKRLRWMMLPAALLLAVTSMVAVACGDDDEDDDDEPTAAATEPAGGETPSAGGEIDISGVSELEDGTLTFGSDIAYAPMEFFDENNEPVGFDIDLGNAIGEALGVEVEFENAGFDSLLPSLDTDRYDAIISSMTVNEDRLAVVDFVQYFEAGFGLVVPSGNPEGIESEEDLCGKVVAVQKGTVQVEYLIGTVDEPGGLDQVCKDAGAEGITVREFDTDPEAVQALIAGQADAEMADYPVAGYSVEQNEGQIELLPVNVDPAPIGIAIRKGNTALADVIQEALDQLIEDGTYDDILAEWGLEDGSIA